MVGIVLLLKQPKRNIRHKMSHNGRFPAEITKNGPKRASLKLKNG